MRKIVIALLMLVLLVGCRDDNTNYFSEAHDEAEQNERAEEQFNAFKDSVGEKLEDFDYTEQASVFPESVYKYNVEKDFPMVDNTETSDKSFKDLWNGMWNTGGDKE